MTKSPFSIKGIACVPISLRGIQLHPFAPVALTVNTRYHASAAAATMKISRSSFHANALIGSSSLNIGLKLCENRQRPPGAARVLDEGVFEIQFDDFDATRRQRFDRSALPGAVADKHHLAPRADAPIAEQSRTWRHFRRLVAELGHHLAHRRFELLHRTIDTQHAVYHDADAIGHALYVAQNVRAEQDRAAAPLDDLDHRFQKITADVGIEA